MSLFDRKELDSFVKESHTPEEKALNRKEFLGWLDDFSQNLKDEIRNKGTLLPKEKEKSEYLKQK